MLKRFAFTAITLLCLGASLHGAEKVKVHSKGTIEKHATNADVYFFKPQKEGLPTEIHFLKKDNPKAIPFVGQEVNIMGTAKVKPNYSLFVWLGSIKKAM